MSERASATPLVNEQDLRDWFRGKDRTWQCAIATRALLRVLPIVFSVLDFPTRELPAKNEKRLVLHTFRTVFLAWSSLKHRLNNTIAIAIEPAATELQRHLGAAREQYPAHYVGLSAQTLGGLFAELPNGIDTSEKVADWEVSLATSVVSHALAAIKAADDTPRSQLFESIAADVKALVDGQDVVDLMQQELWLTEVRGDPKLSVNFPPWSRTVFDKFAGSNLGKLSPWSEWVQWYRGILGSRARGIRQHFSNAREVELAVSASKFWQGDPDDVMSTIQAIRKASPKAVLEISGFARFDTPNPPGADVSVSKLSDSAQGDPFKGRIDGVPPHSDHPTVLDELGRRPFAQALVERMDKARAQGNDGFAVHLHGPWGAGKSSVLLMMAEIMTHTDRKKPNDRRWLTIEFNAWRHESRKTPWWPFLESLKSDSIRELWSQGKIIEAIRILRKWFFWNLTANFGPFIAPLLVAFVLASIGWWITRDMASDRALSALDTIFGIAASAAALFGIFAAVGRILVFRSDANAKDHLELTRNPIKRTAGLFKSMVKIANSPICIFIEDLDRCQSEYVVAMLGAIQTSFRHKNVAYVVAADRVWIKTAFERQYSDFLSSREAPQQLGYLFVEKIFQISCPVPGIDPDLKRRFWEQLLESEGRRKQGVDSYAAPEANKSRTIEDFDRSVGGRRTLLRQKFPEGITEDAAEAALREDATMESRAALILELGSSSAAESQAEHLLARFVDMLPDNPRAMKRMVNTFVMRRAIGILEGASVAPEVLARWTILEQRFPALADTLAGQPEAINEFPAPNSDTSSTTLPESFAEFERVPVSKIIFSDSNLAITADDVRKITMGSRN